MPQPVKISDALLDEARTAAVEADRSMAGQIEHWARLGRAVEAILRPREAGAIKRGARGLAKDIAVPGERAALVRALRFALSAAGHSSLGRVLRESGQTRYGADPAFPGYLVRIAPDGELTPGRLVNRRFIALGESQQTRLAVHSRSRQSGS
jgi:hypothetical protein